MPFAPLLLLLASGPGRAACPADSAALAADIAAADAAYAAWAWDEFNAAAAMVREDLGCLTAVLRAPRVADVYRLFALSGAVTRDEARTEAAFRGLRAVDPAWAPTLDLAPQGSLLRQTFERAQGSAGGRARPLPPGDWTVDGQPGATGLPTRRATLVQLDDGDLHTWYLDGLGVPPDLEERLQAPPAAAPARAQAAPAVRTQRAGVTLGLGYLESWDALSGPSMALRAAGSWRVGRAPVSIGAQAFYRAPWVSEVPGLVNTLVQIAHMGDPDAGFQQPFSIDTFGVDAVADLAPTPDGFEEGFTCAPHLYGGFGLIVRDEYYATYDEDSPDFASVEVFKTAYLLRPLLGIGFDVWYAGHAGLRVALQTRPWFEEQPDYDPNDDAPLGTRFALDASLAIDLLAGF